MLKFLRDDGLTKTYDNIKTVRLIKYIGN